MPAPTNPWPHASRRPLPPMHDRKQLQDYLHKLFSDESLATLEKMLRIAEALNACVRGDDGEVYRRTSQGFACYEPERGWLSLEEFHRGRPDWAPVIIREIAQERGPGWKRGRK